MGFGFSSEGINDRRRGNGLNLSQGRFRLDRRHHFFPPKGCEALAQAALEGFKRRVNAAPRYTHPFSWRPGRAGLTLRTP